MNRPHSITGFVALLGVFVGTICVAGTALAQDGKQKEDGDKKYKEETVYDFEGDTVTGELIKPEGESVRGEQHGKTSSLIDVRSDFVPEMLETVEDL